MEVSVTRSFLLPIIFITLFISISVSGKSFILDNSGTRPDWMKYEGKTHLKVTGAHWFFGFAEGRVENDTRTASYKNAQQQVSFHLGTQVKAMQKDYYEKEGEVTINASIQTGTELLIHSYGIEYYREKWNIEGDIVYKIYSRLEITDSQYTVLERLAMAKVKMVVESSSRSAELEKIFKSIAQKNSWNYEPVIEFVNGNNEKKSLFAKTDTAYVAVISPNISKKESIENSFIMEGDVSLEFYNTIFAVQPKLWNSGFISVSTNDSSSLERSFMGEAFTKLSQKMECDAAINTAVSGGDYSSLNIYDYQFEKLYEDAAKADNDALLFPEKVIALWEAFVNYGININDTRITYAKERINVLENYVTEKSKLKSDFAVDSSKINNLLNMNDESVKRNIAVIRAFIQKYGLSYGASVFETLLNQSNLSPDRKKDIVKFVYDKNWLDELKISCENKNAKACYFYAYGSEKNGKPFNEYEAYYEMSCIGETALACYNLSSILLNNCLKGFELPLNYAQKACELGNYEGCFKVGTIYNSGKCGAKIDYSKALEFFIKSCDAGYYGGCAYAGAVYENNKKKEEALKYYKKACEMGYEKACQVYNNGGALK